MERSREILTTDAQQTPSNVACKGADPVLSALVRIPSGEELLLAKGALAIVGCIMTRLPGPNAGVVGLDKQGLGTGGGD